MTYLGNAFSLAMLTSPETILRVREASVEEVKRLITSGFISSVGHQATSEFLTEILGTPVEMNRISVKLQKGDIVAVAQIQTRLPEGKTLSKEEIHEIPLKWFLVEVLS